MRELHRLPARTPALRPEVRSPRVLLTAVAAAGLVVLIVLLARETESPSSADGEGEGELLVLSVVNPRSSPDVPVVVCVTVRNGSERRRVGDPGSRSDALRVYVSPPGSGAIGMYSYLSVPGLSADRYVETATMEAGEEFLRYFFVETPVVEAEVWAEYLRRPEPGAGTEGTARIRIGTVSSGGRLEGIVGRILTLASAEPEGVLRPVEELLSIAGSDRDEGVRLLCLAALRSLLGEGAAYELSRFLNAPDESDAFRVAVLQLLQVGGGRLEGPARLHDRWFPPR
jgi:hypothetical protein